MTKTHQNVLSVFANELFIYTSIKFNLLQRNKNMYIKYVIFNKLQLLYLEIKLLKIKIHVFLYISSAVWLHCTGKPYSDACIKYLFALTDVCVWVCVCECVCVCERECVCACVCVCVFRWQAQLCMRHRQMVKSLSCNQTGAALKRAVWLFPCFIYATANERPKKSLLCSAGWMEFLFCNYSSELVCESLQGKTSQVFRSGAKCHRILAAASQL